MRPRILVIDDDASIRELISTVLNSCGYDVATAMDGRQALDLLLTPDGYDLLLLDMRMPGMDGWAFSRAYHQLTEHPVPIIVITAAQDAARWAEQIGAQAHLAKPFTLLALRQTVRTFVGPQTAEDN